MCEWCMVVVGEIGGGEGLPDAGPTKVGGTGGVEGGREGEV